MASISIPREAQTDGGVLADQPRPTSERDLLRKFPQIESDGFGGRDFPIEQCGEACNMADVKPCVCNAPGGYDIVNAGDSLCDRRLGGPFPFGVYIRKGGSFNETGKE
jgi:hypothetical protein